MPVAVTTAAFLVLHALLWFARPAPTLWLAASLFLAALWGIAFMRMITREG